jgi:cytochrome c peroxidase
MANRREMISICIYVAVLMLVASLGTAAAASPPLSAQEQLGKLLFFDKNLSTPAGQACAACHAPKVGWTGPDQLVNATGGVYPGAVRTRFGNRKPPASAYAGDSPVLYYDSAKQIWVGGMFWDGRATGWTLGDPLAEQAQGPFLNPLEQNNASPAVVVSKVLASSYKDLFLAVCGTGKTVEQYYECIARAIAAYERSGEVNPFTSKYDYWLQRKTALTWKEEWGRQLFNGRGKCSGCHISSPGPNGDPPLFTDFTYDNLGVPRNPLNPFYREPEWNPLGKNWVDEGLGDFLKAAGYSEDVYTLELGKMKVPTLRNVDKRPNPWFIKAYSHNGYFKSLKKIVHFYNTRDKLPPCADCGGIPGFNCWPKPEEPRNVNKLEMGNLGLISEEEDAIVAFLRTLSDGYDPQCQR